MCNSPSFTYWYGQNKYSGFGQTIKTKLNDGMIFVSLIVCTSECLYQLDGYCSLERAVSGGVPSEENPCVNFVPRRGISQDCGKSFSDISDTDQL